MRNSWKGYVCFSLSESLGLYKQTTWTCLCSFSFTFQGLLHRVYVSSVPRVIHKLLQHKELQPWPDENQHQFFFWWLAHHQWFKKQWPRIATSWTGIWDCVQWRDSCEVFSFPFSTWVDRHAVNSSGCFCIHTNGAGTPQPHCPRLVNYRSHIWTVACCSRLTLTLLNLNIQKALCLILWWRKISLFLSHSHIITTSLLLFAISTELCFW